MEGFAAVLQGDRLITGTIRENIALFRKDASGEMIDAALRTAEIHDWVSTLPMGLNTMVAESMTGLSGGQKQRLLIARAALRRSRVILLDEATASLEVEIEARILSNLRATGAGLIIIAHRPEVWAFADRAIVITDGRASAERGGASAPSPVQRRAG
jgi:ABC-type bacteriocin/lantibiotic exporter with double-glycine peptidase domain